jgi:ferredoxin
VVAFRLVAEEAAPAEAETRPGKVVVDREACMGSGNCVYWAPDVFQLDDDGIALVYGDLAGNEELVRVAMVNCPTSAISISET